MHTSIRIIHIYIHTYIHTCIPYILTYIPGYIHAYIQTYIHTFIHKYIYTFIQFIKEVTIKTYVLSKIPTVPQGRMVFEGLGNLEVNRQNGLSGQLMLDGGELSGHLMMDGGE